MNIRASNLPGEVNRVVKKAALAIDQTLVLSTPVDTGRARSNWLVSLGAPRENAIPPYAPGDQLGLSEGANARAALEQAKNAVASRIPGQDVFITNNIKYIPDLNQGSSRQAPAMFVEMAIVDGVEAVRASTIKTL